MWPKRRRTRVEREREVERFSLCDVQLVESEVEGGLVSRSLPSSSKCEALICVTVEMILKTFR